MGLLVVWFGLGVCCLLLVWFVGMVEYLVWGDALLIALLFVR